jgi:hypothetical protein
MAIVVAMGALVIISNLARSATRQHVRDADRRHTLLVTQRVVLWFSILVVGAFAFASDLG